MQTSMLHRLYWGLIIVAIGVIFLLNQIGVITMGIGEMISTFYPIIMIVFGIQGMLYQPAGAFWWNPIVIFVGVYLLGSNLGWYDWSIGDAIRLLWPVALILFGIGMIFQGKSSGKCGSQRRDGQGDPVTPPIPPTPPMPSGPPPVPPELDEFESRRESSFSQNQGPNLAKTPREDTHSSNANSQWYGWKPNSEQKDWWEGHDWHSKNNYSRFIGDVHLGNEYWELTPMNISMFIGDTTLDLTKAQIPIGETKIYVSSFIGDVKVFVPNDFGVGIQVVSTCLIGDVKVLGQKRGGLFNQMSVETPSYADTDKRVVLVVSSFIGDVRVTKVG